MPGCAGPWSWLRVALTTQFLTLVAAALLVAIIAATQASAETWWKAAATFAGVRLAWCLWLARPSSLEVGPCPPMGAPAPGKRVLSREQLDFFERTGFLVLPGVVDRAEAVAFAEATIWPGLAAQGVDRRDPKGWHTGEKWQIIFPGWCRRCRCCGNGGNVANHNSKGAMVGGAVPAEKQGFPALCQSPALIGALDDLHGCDSDASEGRRWTWLGGGNLGSTHVRYPLALSQPFWYPQGHAGKLWTAPVLGWHIDGAHFQPHYLSSTGQSVIVLPVFGDIAKGGGGTAVVAGSHRKIGAFLRSKEKRGGASYMRLFYQAHWIGNYCGLGCGRGTMHVQETAPCQAGDVLLMHPFLVHSASLNYDSEMRLAFNMGVRWRAAAAATAGADGQEQEGGEEEALIRGDRLQLDELQRRQQHGRGTGEGAETVQEELSPLLTTLLEMADPKADTRQLLLRQWRQQERAEELSKARA